MIDDARPRIIGVTLEPAEREELRRRVVRFGVRRVARDIGLVPNTIARATGGLTVQRASALAIRLSLQG